MVGVADIRSQFEQKNKASGATPPPQQPPKGGGGWKRPNAAKKDEGAEDKKNGGASAAEGAAFLGSVWSAMNKATEATSGAVGGAMEGMMKTGKDFKNPFASEKPKRWGEPKKEEDSSWFRGLFPPSAKNDASDKPANPNQPRHRRAYDPLHEPSRQAGPRGAATCELPPEPEPISEYGVLNEANRGVYKTTRACGQTVERSCGPTGSSGRVLERMQYSDEPLHEAGRITASFANEKVESTTRTCGHGAERMCGRGTFFGRNLEEFQHKYVEKDMHLYEKVPKRPGDGRRVANRYYEDDANPSHYGDNATYPHHLRDNNPQQRVENSSSYHKPGGGYQPGPQSEGLINRLLRPYDDPFEDEYDHMGRVERKDYVPGRLSA